jgi:hypothetical protein
MGDKDVVDLDQLLKRQVADTSSRVNEDVVVNGERGGA